MMIFGAALNGLILGALLLLLLGEDIQENFMPAVAAVGIPSVLSIVPKLYFEGSLGYVLSLVVFLGGFYFLLKLFFDLAPSGALKVMVMFLGIRLLVALLLGFLFSA